MEVYIISNKDLLINEEIRDKEVRVIDADGEQLGIMNTKDAKQVAIDKNLDLVKIAPQGIPPVCRIMDYGKYKFSLAKKEKEARKNQKIVKIKEVKLTPAIDIHDFDTKVSHALKFLQDGDKVKVTLRFRGREVAHANLSLKLLQRFAEKFEEIAIVEKQPKLEGKNMIMFLAPKQ